MYNSPADVHKTNVPFPRKSTRTSPTRLSFDELCYWYDAVLQAHCLPYPVGTTLDDAETAAY